MDECDCDDCYICADKDKTCLLCQQTYKLYPDPFTIIISSKTFADITNLLCLKCVHSFAKCMNCHRALDEPWEKVYYDIDTKEYKCPCCLNDVRNKEYKKCSLFRCRNCLTTKKK